MYISFLWNIRFKFHANKKHTKVSYYLMSHVVQYFVSIIFCIKEDIFYTKIDACY